MRRPIYTGSKVVQDERAATVSYAAAPDIRAVLEPLRALSPQFERHWAEMRVEESPIWSKALVGPSGEVTTYDYFMLTPAGVGKEMTISLYRKRRQAVQASIPEQALVH